MSSWYQLVPVQEMQAAAAADDLGACRERLPAGEHHPVLAGGLGAIGAEFGQGEPVMIGAVAAEQRDPGARHRQGAGAFDVVVPAGHGVIADAHDREIGVIAGPGARVVHVEGIAVTDRIPRADLGVSRVVPDGLQPGREPDDPVGADRLFGAVLAPAVVAVDSLVEVADPDLPVAGGQDMPDPVAEHALSHDLPVGVVEHAVAVRAVAAPPAPGPGHQEPAAGHGLHGDMRERQVRDRGDRCQFRRVHRDPRGHRPGRGRIRETRPGSRDRRRGHRPQAVRCRPYRHHFAGRPDRRADQDVTVVAADHAMTADPQDRKAHHLISPDPVPVPLLFPPVTHSGTPGR